jgi:hypothetical protein
MKKLARFRFHTHQAPTYGYPAPAPLLRSSCSFWHPRVLPHEVSLNEAYAIAVRLAVDAYSSVTFGPVQKEATFSMVGRRLVAQLCPNISILARIRASCPRVTAPQKRKQFA